MTRIDFKKELKSLYQASAKAVAAVDAPALNFLMIDGQGDPNHSPAYGEAVSALYTLAYTLKFAVKKAAGADYAVMPLEGLWWVDDMRRFDINRKADWQWTMLIMQPGYVTAEAVAAALPAAIKKKDSAALRRMRFESYAEGQAAQVLHIGPYATEGPTIARLHAFIDQNGRQRRGKHHEIYLGDPNRTQPEKLKTIIRQPFE